jgi:hypothetical protein
MEVHSIIFESPAHNILHLKNMITLAIRGKPDLQRSGDFAGAQEQKPLLQF